MEASFRVFIRDDKSLQGIQLQWAEEDYGFGEIDIITKDEKVQIHSEYMSKEFVMRILKKIVDDAELID
jgi:hypothetical protein